jgi:hypothetical protein
VGVVGGALGFRHAGVAFAVFDAALLGDRHFLRGGGSRGDDGGGDGGIG